MLLNIYISLLSVLDQHEEKISTKSLQLQWEKYLCSYIRTERTTSKADRNTNIKEQAKSSH